jgi:hypothetical protein
LSQGGACTVSEKDDKATAGGAIVLIKSDKFRKGLFGKTYGNFSSHRHHKAAKLREFFSTPS